MLPPHQVAPKALSVPPGVALHAARKGPGSGTDPAKRLRVAVVGCGIGSRHARTIHRLQAEFELVAVCDPDPARVNALTRQIPNVAAATDFAELLRTESIDLVSICTPSAMHFQHALAGLNAGVNVVCEKPVSGSVREIDLLAQAARRSRRQVFPIFQNRFGRGVRQLKFLVEQGMTGRRYLSVVETAWRRTESYYATAWRRSWRSSLGGALINQAIHAHDLLCYVGGPARRVSAFARTLVNPVETEDCSVAALEMADGSLASLAVTLGSAIEISRLRFCYERLVAESNTHPYDTASDPWQFKGTDPAVDSEIVRALEAFAVSPEGYEGQYLDIHRAITQGIDASVTLNDARTAIELTTALYESVETGAAVHLPIASEDPLYAGNRFLRRADRL